MVGPLDVNCYIVWDKKTRDAVIIDPGGDAAVIEEEALDRGLTVRHIINTHGHFDHVGADEELKHSMEAGVAIHFSDRALLENFGRQCAQFGCAAVKRNPSADLFIEDGMELGFGGLALRVLHTPGHTPGGVTLLIEGEKVIFTGDTLFAGSVGRTDLPGGSSDTLMDSIKEKILPLGDDVMVFPGHGPETTVGDERRSNPFLEGL
ncbi:MAG: MBL fold metallo-hydrolase [Deltaproteobacteria bacterium]|nr:MBL fold metallo-hydrolase [Deltaproteobacteria bacterium]